MNIAHALTGSFPDLYYRHSGKFTAQGVAAGLAAGITAGMLLAGGYAFLGLKIPYVVIQMMLPLGFGAALGLATAEMLKRQKVRNGPMTCGVTFLIALFAYYMSWCVWLTLAFRDAGIHLGLAGFVGLTTSPEAVWQLIANLGLQGTMTVSEHGRKDMTVSGWQMWMLWSMEALAVIGIAVLTARQWIQRFPFCENCGTWCEREQTVAWVTDTDQKELKQHLEWKDFHFVHTHRGAMDLPAVFRLDMHSCPKCNELHTLSARWISCKKDKLGREHKAEKVVVDKILVSASEAEQLRAVEQPQTERQAAL